jgi:hypothetical protein
MAVAILVTALARGLPADLRTARCERERCTCSATFAKWKYVEKARDNAIAVANSTLASSSEV